MTATYRLLNNIFEYEEAYVDFRAMRKQTKGLKVRFADENVSLQQLIPNWVPVSVNFEKEYKKAIRPDVAVWNNTCLVLSDKGKETLSPIIGSSGEFLPLENDFHLFNSLTSVSNEALNEELSQFDPDDYMRPTKIVLNNNAIKGIPLFKAGFASNSFLLCSDEFKQCCIDEGINGLIFEEELARVFPTRK